MGNLRHSDIWQRSYFWEQSLSCTSQIPYRPPFSSGGPSCTCWGQGLGWGHLCQDPADLCSCLTLSSCRGGVGCRRCSLWAVCRLQAGDPFPPNPRGTEVGRETAGCNWSAKEWNGTGLPVLGWVGLQAARPSCWTFNPSLSYFSLPSILGIDVTHLSQVPEMSPEEFEHLAKDRALW